MTPAQIHSAHELLRKRAKLEGAIGLLDFPCSLRLQTQACRGGEIVFMLEDHDVNLERLFQTTLQSKLDEINAALAELGVVEG